ncbi:hypothetical protein MJO29_001830 [Puccinia striiformis f. sp. tritici]|nr:hypothetical protein MJO29_001830 [Puccinia striiformis f. sp. tritici]
MINIDKLSAFIKNGSNKITVSPDDLHILSAWSLNTLLGYNCAVKKFMIWKFQSGIEDFRLPMTVLDIERFCLWAGRSFYLVNNHKVNSQTIKKYLSGFKAWHDFHRATYPTVFRDRLKLILKASAKVDATTIKRQKKPPILLRHLVWLTDSLSMGRPKEQAVSELAIIAFWGMARIGELTYLTGDGPLEREYFLLTTDVELIASDTGGYMLLTLLNAKTSTPGKNQTIRLHKLKNMLCPVEAVSRRLIEAGGFEASLFGYYEHGIRFHLTRAVTVGLIQTTLKKGGFDGLLGHSFRVGGASLRSALGVSDSNICVLGQWVLKCYELYIRRYSPDDLEEAKAIIRMLNELWEEI